MPVSLNPRQREAVEHVHGPMLVVAGAGTGKTTVLVERIARLIREGKAKAGEILAVTFTDDAAAEMRKRLEDDLGAAAAGGLYAGTFHAFCYGLLKRRGRGFNVLDDQDLWVFLRRRLRELRLEHFIKAASPGEFLSQLLDFYKRCHDELVDPERFEQYVAEVEAGRRPAPRVCKASQVDEMPRAEKLGRLRELARVFRKAEEILAAGGLGTFGHMITGAMALLRRDPALLAEERRRARFILIDEFQDANLAQIELAHVLAGDEQNVFAVGDPDQAIYRFRGATSGAFEQFLARFPQARAVTLEENQRSTPPVLQCAGSLIARNPSIVRGRLDFQRRTLRSARDERARAAGGRLPAPAVEIVLAGDIRAEAAYVARSIEARRRAGCKLSDCAVLYRNHDHRDALAEELAEREIPFEVTGLNVLETRPVRDLLAALRAIAFPDDSVSLLRVASFPIFRLRPAEVREACAGAKRGDTLVRVLEKVEGGAAVLELLQRARALAESAQWQMVRILEPMARLFGLETSSPAVAALRAFVERWREKPLTEKGTAQEFFDYLDDFVAAGGGVALPASQGRDAVQLMTAHGAKGLEFQHVYVLRASSGSFPGGYRENLFEFPQELRDARAPAEDDNKELHAQEERRLFYVAMTRARDSLTILAKPGKGRDRRPPRFPRELLDDRKLTQVLVMRDAEPFTVDLAAEAAAESSVAPWLNLPAREGLAREALSATAIQAYETCPLQFKLSRDWRLPEEPGAALQYGAVMHTVLKAVYDAVRAGRPMSDDQVVQMFRELLDGAGLQDEYQRQLYGGQGERQLRDFLAARRAESQPEVLDTERSFRVEIGGVLVSGRLDRLDSLGDGRVAIVDYKTGSPRKQDDADESLQLSIYAIAAARAWALKPERLVFYNLETNQPVVSTRTETQLVEQEERVRTAAQNIRVGDFEPKPGYHCRYCGYRSLCPAQEARLYGIAPAARARGVD